MSNIGSLGDKKKKGDLEVVQSENGEGEGGAGRIEENQEGCFLDSGQGK